MTRKYTATAEWPSNDDENAKKAAAVIIGALALPAVIFGLTVGVLLCLWQAYVITWLWAWFVTPLFKLPLLTVPIAYGILLMVRIFTFQVQPKETQSFLAYMVSMIVMPAVALLIGYILHIYFI